MEYSLLPRRFDSRSVSAAVAAETDPARVHQLLYTKIRNAMRVLAEKLAAESRDEQVVGLRSQKRGRCALSSTTSLQLASLWCARAVRPPCEASLQARAGAEPSV
jgi:hypothetical protein